MANLLLIETSSKNCSVGISAHGRLLAVEELSEASFSHAEKLHPFIESTLKQAGLTSKELAGVVVGKGPGSYTGLRIGVAAAKGLCFALNIPLMSVGSLETLAMTAIETITTSYDFIIPMIDARRMEVYTAIFDTKGRQLKAPWAEVLDNDSYTEYLTKGQCLFIGDGQQKWEAVVSHSNASFETTIKEPSIRYMMALGTQKFEAENVEDLAYFEPFYLKEFYTTPPKK